MNILDSNDPLQSADQNIQQSPAQDLDMTATQYALSMTYVFFASGISLSGPGHNITPTNPNVTAQFSLEYGSSPNAGGSYGTNGVTVLSPLGAPVETVFGTETSESDGGNFYTTIGYVQGELAFCYGFRYVDNFPYPGIFYQQGYFGFPQNGTVAILGNTFLRPGTWELILQTGPVLNCTGSIVVAGQKTTVAVTGFNTTGYSALGGAANGNVQFVVPLGGGYLQFIFETQTESGPASCTFPFTWLHA